MRLHVDVHGQGQRVAVLLHGMMGSSESWWRVAPLLVEHGYRVLAIDLPGHGLSPRDPELTVERAADAITMTVQAEAVEPPALAIGHSFGGLVLAAAAEALRPGLAVYVDAPFRSRGGWDLTEAVAEYESDRKERTYERLRASRPYYSRQDCVVEARAAERFDPASAASVAAAEKGAWPPAPGSIVVRPEPSDYIDTQSAAKLSEQAVQVRSIPGAAHSVWYSHFNEFVATLPEAFG